VQAPSAIEIDASVRDAGFGTDANNIVNLSTKVHVRVAHFVPSMGMLPALDLCTTATGGSNPLTGPLLARDGIATGLRLGQVSEYFDVVSSTVDVVAVAAATHDCRTPILPPQTGVELGPAGTFITLVLLGVPTPADAGPNPFLYRMVVLHDRNPMSATGSPEPPPALRVFDAVPSATRLDLGLMPDGTISSFITLFEDIGFGELGRPPASRRMNIDANGYFETVPGMGLNLGARPTCSGMPSPCMAPLALQLTGVNVPSRALSTVFLTVLETGEAAAVMCADNVPPVAAGYSACQQMP
jgi:hypothetical protein